MKIFCYKRLLIHEKTFLPQDLDYYGAHGWELVSVIFDQGHYQFFFKREIISVERKIDPEDNRDD